MKHSFLALVSLLMMAVVVNAQQITATTMTLGSDVLQAYSTTVTHSAEDAAAVVARTFEGMGLRVDNIDGAYAAVGQTVDSLGVVDIYARVVRSGDEPTTVSIAAVPVEGNEVDNALLQRRLHALLTAITLGDYGDRQAVDTKKSGNVIDQMQRNPLSKDGKLSRLSSGMKVKDVKVDDRMRRTLPQTQVEQTEETQGVLDLLK